MPALSVAEKLKIREGQTLMTINAPENFAAQLDHLPGEVKIMKNGKTFHQIHWFVKDKTQMGRELSKVMKMMKEGILLWIYFPKGTSKIQTDITRDHGWDTVKPYGLKSVNLISFDETWSAFGMRLKSEKEKKGGVFKKSRLIHNYIDAATRTIALPHDFEKELMKNKAEQKFFDTLSFTNKKEYVEWIVNAKKEETRSSRIEESIIRLGKRWKNPANR